MCFLFRKKYKRSPKPAIVSSISSLFKGTGTHGGHPGQKEGGKPSGQHPPGNVHPFGGFI